MTISYLEPIFQNPEAITMKFRKALATMPHIDVLVGTGISGNVAASILGYASMKRFVIVRKYGASTHSTNSIEGRIESKDKWLFVDDLIDSGVALRSVHGAIHNRQSEAEFVGAFLFTHDSGDTPHYVSAADLIEAYSL